ncbi:hypothetical protein MalM25_32060 [Planctomycetes bacterium MalM25]|nr:hypothetical protein MalM25_32060 [Planctomycetes bacterium MalM25]
MPPQGPEAAELRDLAEQTRGVVGDLRETLGSAADERRERLGRLSDEASQLVESLASQVANELSQDLARQQEEQAAAARQQLDDERSGLQSEREAFDAEREAWQAERGAWQAEHDQQASEHEAERAERAQWEADRDAWQAEREQWEAVRNQVEAELASQEQRLLAERQEIEANRQSGGDADDVLYEKLELAVTERDQAHEKLGGVEARVGELTAALAEATGRLTAATEVEQELGTLREKFDLVMTDLQAHREHVAALEGELATRPETAGADPAELEQLRQDRDELARQLEEQAHAGEPVEPSAEVNELRARFEMAVEDVRQLRTENEELRQKLDSAPAGGDAASEGDGWEAQKQRLLASLSDEGDAVEPERQEERATIAGTLQITDEVVAEKDREIERLRQELEQAPADNGEAVVDEAQAALLDEDEVIQAERERLAALEAECQEKLRQAELELSVERAKISRAQSQLEEQQIELETLKGACSTGGESKRRWMDKLGLGNDSK